ncbi:UV DNA damage repair endonuclease UvsE [Peptoniphilus sp. MSJ-1]|uniref:UV DNA damage repair endonuclease UvsE n=1 Tax=Peptoniphilus ovalis TaxID=2841503 RepID=A0ABS6FHI7_9FIRM|nr:UV DNA damage repair endonuclease UvsE [Peptoniphilus ovalis]MBU5668700.1 UV DNA damage repair endonuclease UvsE [Peptoniphilus ovalis]
MTIGYACLTVGVLSVKFKTCRKDNVTDEKLIELIDYNLASLENMLDYNIKNNIKLMRISSDIIPFGSHEVNKIKWWEIFSDKIFEIGELAKNNGIRLSMHPGQYTVINSPREDVVERAFKDLEYHNRFLDALNLDSTNKIILHIGGAYGDKIKSIDRFCENYQKLDDGIKDRLVIENDDKIYNISEVLEIGNRLNIPVVYDNLHNAVNPYDDKSDGYYVREANKTWGKKDGVQKVHYSQQDRDKKSGSHSSTIDLREFHDYYKEVSGDKIDIMLEVKDKNLSAVKCNNLVGSKKIKKLEDEWAKYKYLVLEHSPKIYNDIRNLLKDKSYYPVIEFYDLIDEALKIKLSAGHIVNAAEHIWGYFKDGEDEKSRLKYKRELKKVSEGKSSNKLKRMLFELSIIYNNKYLLESLYFKDII